MAVRRTIHWAERCRAGAAPARPGPVRHRAGRDRPGPARRVRAGPGRARFPRLRTGRLQRRRSGGRDARRAGRRRGAAAREQAALSDGRGPAPGPAGGVAAGIDMFDCVMPTRNGRNAWRSLPTGHCGCATPVHKRDSAPLESGCPCYTCRHFSRAYLHHLFIAEEMLGPTLLSLHNVAFYCRLMAQTRAAIDARQFVAFHPGMQGAGRERTKSPRTNDQKDLRAFGKRGQAPLCAAPFGPFRQRCLTPFFRTL